MYQTLQANEQPDLSPTTYLAAKAKLLCLKESDLFKLILEYLTRQQI
jgi:hypothetical protein